MRGGGQGKGMSGAAARTGKEHKDWWKNKEKGNYGGLVKKQTVHWRIVNIKYIGV